VWVAEEAYGLRGAVPPMARGQWTEVSQAEFPVDKALRNLYINFWGYTAKDDPKGTLVKWEDKARQDSFFADRPDTIQQYFDRKRAYCAMP
jgi:hypothetical protein